MRRTSLLTGLLALAGAVAPAGLAWCRDAADAEVLFSLLNDRRRARGVPALEADPELFAAAMARAGERSRGQGVPRTDEEIVERAAVGADLMSVHRALLGISDRPGPLDRVVARAGVGVARDDEGRVHAVQLLARGEADSPHLASAERLPRAAASAGRGPATAVAGRRGGVGAPAETLRRALAGIPRAPGVGPAVEVPRLSREAERLAKRLAELDAQGNPGMPPIDRGMTYNYVTSDPAWMPGMLRDLVAGARRHGIGVEWRRTARRPEGAYFVVVVLQGFA